MRLKELQDLIDTANEAYYTDGNAIMEDVRYDKLKKELEKLNPSDSRLSTVGASIRDTILQKRKHNIPMGSLSKCLNEGEFNSWITNNLIKNGINKSELFHASLKMDGGSIGLEYENGKLILAISRGDGFYGEDITANALKFKNLPKYPKHNGVSFTGYVRGEAVLEEADWKIVDPEKLSNPRNQVVGLSRRKDGSLSEYVSFYSFRAFDVDGTPIGDTEEEMSKSMQRMGFDVAPYFVGSKDEVWKWYNKMATERTTLNFWIDGCVLKLNNIETQLSLGESGGCPKGQCAIKFDAEGEITTLLSVNINVGNTGAITPVGNFTPVRIGGTTVSCANLCNWDNIKQLGICIGDKISVIKAGDIIPRIMEVTEQGKKRINIEMPTKCPCCSGKVGNKTNVGGGDSTTIYCLNDECPAIIRGKIDRYLSSLDILGIGESVIDALVKNKYVKNPSDLYTLHAKEDKLADMVLGDKVKFGEKRTIKLIEEIEKKRELTISEFIGSLGIFGLGKRRVALIQDAMNGKMDTLDSWLDNTLIDNAQKAGVPNLAENINKELMSMKQYIQSFLNNGLKIINPQPKQVAKKGAFEICITGKLSAPKKVFQDKIEANGHVYVDSMTSNTTHLVAADINSGSSKLVKAAKKGIKVISEEDLLNLIK